MLLERQVIGTKVLGIKKKTIIKKNFLVKLLQIKSKLPKANTTHCSKKKRIISDHLINMYS